MNGFFCFISVEKTSIQKSVWQHLTAEDGGSIMIKEAIIKLSKKEDLSYEMAQTVMDEIMTGEADDIQKSAYLTALAMKGRND